MRCLPLPVLLAGHTHRSRRKARRTQRRHSRKRCPWVSLYISLRCDTSVRSCCSVLGSLAPRLASLWPFLPGPGPAHSTAATECSPGSLSAWWPSHLQAKRCDCKRAPGCFGGISTTHPTEAIPIMSKKCPVESFMNTYKFENTGCDHILRIIKRY